MRALPSGAFKQKIESHTHFSSSRMQGYTEMREPHSVQMVWTRLDAKLHGYHDYIWKEDLPPVCHSDISLTYIKRIIFRSRIPVIEAPRVEGVRVPFGMWRHIFQVKDQSTLTDMQGQWCFLHAEKDDVQFEGKVYNTWYDR